MISVIIPTKDNLPLLKQCIQSIQLTLPFGDGYEFIVVDNGDGESARWVKDTIALSKGIHRAPLTFAKACNIGVRESSGTRLMLCNDDIIFTEHFCRVVAGVYAPFYQNESIMGFRLTYPNGLIQHGGVGFDMGGNPYHLWHLAPTEHPEAVKSYPVPAVTFALALIRRDVWDKLGGLDEQFINSYEDVDFCLRAREAGYMTWYSGKNSAIHLTGQTAGRNDHVAESWQHFGEKWLADGRLYRALGIWPMERS